MSHHLDSELARRDPRLDISDVYLFRGSTGTVFVMNVDPLSGRHGFHPEGMYEFKVDLDADAVEDITFRFVFDAIEAEDDADATADHDHPQRWSLRVLHGPEATDRDAAGVELLRGATDAVSVSADGGIRAWAGPAADPFWIEGTVVTAVRTALAEGKGLDLAGFDTDRAENPFQGTDVGAIVLEVADHVLAADTIGFWGVSVLATDAGGWRQINRCATPLINTLFELEDAERGIDFNATRPDEDRVLYGPRVMRDTSATRAAMAGTADASAHAERVRDLLFPDVLRYEIGTEASFTPERRNGRPFADCTPEAMFEIVLGTRVALGLDASSAGVPRADFPYVPLPTATRQS
ncbi:DUF4331 family protein [Wenjunlia tyrosinilytica]|uniref:DUF4331 domain-containing protein n=1 Tax=Wenjunlia tyrosinilytica TaxID=1544741 RepID=A0A917ZVU2_9ACTN|nr:DUF4331 family protein [Wenjunlia tyrosinilytica]GGO94595.1 hypothetical protein GCM10012280_49870 [Wenjunlia tyrosinilytica]